MISVSQLTDSIASAGEACGFSLETYGKTSIAPLIALRRPAPPDAPRVYVSSGAHGDEPAGPNALLRLLQDDLLPRDVDLTLCPVINPLGLASGTRENANGIDLNRDFLDPKENETRALVSYLDRLDPFHLSLCLHEDWESSGFYLYHMGGEAATRVAKAMVEAVSRCGPIDRSSLIDGFDAKDGRIAPPEPIDVADRADWPEAFYLQTRFYHSHFTTESPSSLPLDLRIAMQITATRVAIESLRPSLQAARRLGTE